MVKTLRSTQKADGAPNTTGQKHHLICTLILLWAGKSQGFFKALNQEAKESSQNIQSNPGNATFGCNEIPPLTMTFYTPDILTSNRLKDKDLLYIHQRRITLS